MSNRDVIVGIDIGSTKVATIIGHASENGAIDIIGVGFHESHGVRKGMIVDIEETISSISGSLEEAERMSGLPIKEAYINIGGTHIQSTSSRGVIAVSRGDGEIDVNDTLRAIDAAKSMSTPPNRDILYAAPRYYSVDGQEGIKDPVGMAGIRLEVETQIISGATTAIKNMNKCVEQAGVAPLEYVFTPLAAAYAVLTKRQKEIGVALVDIGGGTTSFAIYEEGALLHAGVIPVGAAHITNDIAIGLRTNIDTAERIKIEYGSAFPEKVADKEIDLKKINSEEEGKISLKYLSEIIEARTTEILQLVKEEIRKVGRDGMLPAGVVFTGGGAKQQGLIDLAKQTLKLPAHIGSLDDRYSGMVDNIFDPLYSASVGLLLWGLEAGNHEGTVKPSSSQKLGSVMGKARGLFKQFLP